MESDQVARRVPSLVTSGCIAAFLVTLPLDWPQLPLNARLPDLLFVVAAVALVATRPLFPRFHWLDALVLLYIVGGLPSLLETDDLTTSSVELGRQLYLVSIYAVIAIAVVNGHVRVVVVGLATGGAVLAVVGIGAALVHVVRPIDAAALGETMTLPYVGQVLRLRGFAASPAMLTCALTVTVALIAAAICARVTESRALLVSTLTLSVVAAMLTFSHALAGIVVAGVIGAWRCLHSNRTTRLVAIGAATAIVVVLNGVLIASARTIRVGGVRFSDGAASHQAVETRLIDTGPIQVEYEIVSYFRLKELAVSALSAHPWTGIGLDRFHVVTEHSYRAGRLPFMYRAADPHSTLLGRMAETGIVGGATLGLLWWGIGRLGWRLSQRSNADAWVAWGVFAAFIGLVISSINVDIMNFRFLWAGFGVVRGLTERAHL